MPSSPAANRWPQLVALLGLFFVGLTAWAVLRAHTGVSQVIDRSYYDHGLRYNHTLLERQAAESLGWQVAVSVREGELESRLTDRDGGPVTGAAGELQLGDTRLTLAEKAAGLYAAPLPPAHRGEVSALLLLQRNGASLRRHLLLSR